MRNLSMYERETIINFNQAGKLARIFTYEEKWQRHIETKLGLEPIYDNGYGGKEYEIEKKRIPMPRVKIILSPEEKQRRGKGLEDYRHNAFLGAKT